jgi:hypothetical protein
MAYKTAMQLRRLVLSSVVILAACGGGKKKPPAEPTPAASEPAGATDTAAAPAPENKEAAAAPAPPPPPPPKLVLGDAKIMMKGMKKKVTVMEAEIVLAGDGTITANVIGKKKEKKTTTGKLTADGQMMDDKGEVVAKIGDGGSVMARQIKEEKQDGKVVKSDTSWEDVGTLSDDGVFTNKKDGKTMSIDDKGKVTGFPPDMQFTVTAGAEQKKAAMFVVVGMMAASKMTMDSGGAKAEAAPVPAPKK